MTKDEKRIYDLRMQMSWRLTARINEEAARTGASKVETIRALIDEGLIERARRRDGK